MDPSDSEPLRVEVPAPVVPAIGRVRTVRHCTHREDGRHCARCEQIRSADVVLRAVATIRDALRSTPSLHERLIELRDVHAYEAAHEQERALACGAGETKREHDVAAAEHAGMERVLSAVLSLHGGNVQREEPAETVR